VDLPVRNFKFKIAGVQFSNSNYYNVIYSSMGSWRNVVKRKTHKERGQVASRKGLGPLEKKKDYRKRAADFHKKQDALKALERKAAFANPDEFTHDMTRATTRGGVRVVTTGKTFTAAEIRDLKTQDLAHIRLRRTQEQKMLEKLESRLHFTSELGAAALGVAPSAASTAADAVLEEPEDPLVAAARRKELRKAAELRLRRMNAVAISRERVQQLKELEDALELTQRLQAKGNVRKTVDADGNATFRWTQARKR
jgi:U3 small nucleolar RNA-associated protein 11